jgi:hypothetical protein
MVVVKAVTVTMVTAEMATTLVATSSASLAYGSDYGLLDQPRDVVVVFWA